MPKIYTNRVRIAKYDKETHISFHHDDYEKHIKPKYDVNARWNVVKLDDVRWLLKPIVNGKAGAWFGQGYAKGVRITHNNYTPEWMQLSPFGKTDVEFEYTGRGIEFMLPEQRQKPHERAYAPRGKNKGMVGVPKGVALGGKPQLPESLDEFRRAVNTVNKLRRACSAVLSVHNGALFAEITVEQKIKLS